jgi:hopene-associated glycosyltransferase HpnB
VAAEVLVSISLGVWIYLFFLRGFFWRSTPELQPARPLERPAVDIIVPARNEAQSIGSAITSLRQQDYGGPFRIILVDDNSFDGTATLVGSGSDLEVITLVDKPAGWSGKLWALNNGINASRAPVLLFTDADIVHDPRHLSALVARLTESHAVLVSEMVRLNCESFAECALIPAFVYFFQMLYPFSKVNDARSSVAAAAGGTVLIRRDALEAIGGIHSIRNALIDDVALATAVKTQGPIYLGHSTLARSIRPYPHFRDIWNMISRTAFTQLRYSLPLLLATVLGLSLVWLVPVYAVIFCHGGQLWLGLSACCLAAVSFLPTLARYRRPKLWSLVLPFIALFFLAATVYSACNRWFGRGSNWKSRAYGPGA